jgi:ATP-binding dynein motor region
VCPSIPLQVVRMGADTTVGVMERAMEAGHSVLIENMGESVDAVLLPIITRSTVKKGRNLFVKLGDKDVEYNRNFKLFMHTKLSNPHYPPEIQAETTLINFTVTEKVRQQHVDCSTTVCCCNGMLRHRAPPVVLLINHTDADADALLMMMLVH